MSNVEALIQRAENQISPAFKRIDAVTYQNQKRVLDSFKSHRVSPDHFTAGTGYGYNDLGRETLESMYAEIFGGEDALVRSQMVSGTHALSCCLFALLNPDDLLVSAIGRPYDTLHRIITGKNGLTGRGIRYVENPVDEDGACDLKELAAALAMKPRLVLLQRSLGYSSERRSLTITDLSEIIAVIQKTNPQTLVLVDNCYGEFVENQEPGHIGADLTAGSMIKNPGGGLAAGGGYVVGRKELVELVADNLVAPGLGKEIGPSLYDLRTVYQGLFLAPHVVGEALKGAVLVSGVLGSLGIEVSPEWHEERGDIVQVIHLRDLQQLEAFVRVVQASSPVDSHVLPEFGSMPGYEDDIIMAAGTFVQGASIELSCDAPRRQPFLAFMQGGLTYQHIRYVVSELVRVLYRFEAQGKDSCDGESRHHQPGGTGGRGR